MNRLGCLVILLAVMLAAILPLAFTGCVEGTLEKLGLPPDVAALALLAILIGGAIHIPLWRFETPGVLCVDPLAVVGLPGLLPHLEGRRKSCVIAVNAGGCLVPLALVTHQVVRLVRAGAPADGTEGPGVVGILLAMVIATAANVFVCWKLARPVPCVGIAVPGFVPAVVAAASALFLAADSAPGVALVSGVLGPIVGAGVLHLRDLKTLPVGLASIGGAGTYDAVVLSCVLPLCLG